MGGRTKDGMQVLVISTYDYTRNTCLHYIHELELLCIALGCDCYMMNTIQHKYPSLIQCIHFSHIGFAKLLLLLLLLQSSQTAIVTVPVTIAIVATTIKTIILLCY